MEDQQQPHRSTHDPTLAQYIGGDRNSSGVPLPAPLACQIVSEIAAELDDLHSRGRTHGDVRAARIAVPPTGPAYLLKAQGPRTSMQIRDDGDVVLYSLDVTIDEDVTGLVTAAYFALSGTPPDHLFPLSLPRGAARCRPPMGIFDVLAKGLGQPRGNRYASAGAFADALQAAASPSPSGPTAEPLRAPSSVSRLAAWALLASTGTALLALGMWLGHQQPQGQAGDALPLARLSAAAPTNDSPLSSPAVSWHGRRLATIDWVTPPMLSQAKALQRRRSAAKPPVRPPRTLPADRWGMPTAHAPVTRLASLSHLFRPAPILPTRQDRVSSRKTAGAQCYLLVYARQFLSKEDLLNNRPQFVRPQRVLVDGQPSTSLAAGRWTPLAPGLHRLAFYPAHGGPFDANANISIRLAPGRQSFQIPLPRHPHDVPTVSPTKISPSPLEQELEGRSEATQESERGDLDSHGTVGNQPETEDVSSISSEKTFGGRRTGL